MNYGYNRVSSDKQTVVINHEVLGKLKIEN